MKTPNQHLKKAFMWNKVKELSSKGLNKSQISAELKLDRGTVRKYLSMSEDEFYHWIQKPHNRPMKLRVYATYVKESLEAHPYLSASQMEDWLKEHYADFPDVHSKTVYNFVEQIRAKYDISKCNEKQPRQYEKLQETDYGDQAQVDFGSYHMLTKESGRKKVYFFAMVLCRSRQKYIYLQTSPFTTQTTIDAHNKAFEYFQGQPRKLIYDQDRVLIVDENLGDLLLTKEFRTYCSQMSFTPVFCRKSDPESKGKVENVVGYVKKNFLRGRIFEGEKVLNESAQSWLSRTGNGKTHAGIQKIPHQEWLIERQYLQSYYQQPESNPELIAYKVRKDHTISYKGNFYTLPLNTYKGPETKVLLKTEEDILYLYDTDSTLLTTHRLCPDRGQTIRNTDHRRDKSQSLEILKTEVDQLFSSIPGYKIFIERLTREKQRYLRDNLQVLKNKAAQITPDILAKAIDECIDKSSYNANTLIQIALHYQKEEEIIIQNRTPLIDVNLSSTEKYRYTPTFSQINTYEQIMQ